MDVKIIWQVKSNPYTSEFLRYDVMGISVLFSKRKYASIESSISNFYRTAKRNDIVILRSGVNKISAVGIIVGYRPVIRNDFRDIDGHLLHIRRIRWLTKTNKQFPAKTLGNRTNSFAIVNAPAVLNWVKGIKIPRQSLTQPLKRLPRSRVPANSIILN